MVKVGNGNRLGDLEEVQEEMVEPELMVVLREKSGGRMLLLEERRWEQLSCELGGCLCKTESSAHWCPLLYPHCRLKGGEKSEN